MVTQARNVTRLDIVEALYQTTERISEENENVAYHLAMSGRFFDNPEEAAQFRYQIDHQPSKNVLFARTLNKILQTEVSPT